MTARPHDPPLARRALALLAFAALAAGGVRLVIGRDLPPAGHPWVEGALACAGSAAVAALLLRGRPRRRAAGALAAIAVALATAAAASVGLTDDLGADAPASGATGDPLAIARPRTAEAGPKAGPAAGPDAASDAGPDAASDAGPDAGAFRVLSWNILFGADRAFGANGWPTRRGVLASAIARERPDVLGVQEARPDQVAFLERTLPDHARVGVGRDDGGAGGEHCALFIARARFDVLESGTFWLSDTPDRPSRTWSHPFPRICTWARVVERRSGARLCVLNTHLPLAAEARRRAAALIADRARALADPVLLLGDLNCGPGSPPWRALEASGLREAATALGRSPPRTYHLRGLPLACLDAVFVDPERLDVLDHRIARWRRAGLFPSDHFGVAVVLRAR